MASSSQLLPIAEYASALHASTDFREKLYKVFQYAAKLAAAQPRASPRLAHVASTLSQSRGIFKLLKGVGSAKSLPGALSEKSPLLRRLKVLEASLGSAVATMQDIVTLNKLLGLNAVGAKFAW